LRPRDRRRQLGSAAGLLVAVFGAFGLFTDGWLGVALVLTLTGLLAVAKPALPRQLLPWLLLLCGMYAFLCAGRTQGGTQHMLFLTVLAGLGNLPMNLAMPLAWVYLAAGAWLAWRTPWIRSWLIRHLPRVFGTPGAAATNPRWALLLVPVTAMTGELLLYRRWNGIGPAGLVLGLLLVALAAVLVARLPQVAVDLSVVWLAVLGLCGIGLALSWPSLAFVPGGIPMGLFPGVFDKAIYGAVLVSNRPTAALAGVEGAALLALAGWLAPRTIVAHTRALLAGEAYTALLSRVQQLTETRTVAVGSAAAELRRIERDLHDGAQARLVALGMNLRAVERLITVSPQAALSLVTEARESSSQALAELRDLVRGIYPPVLADRGLADAVQALALDLPLPTEVDIELAGRPEGPVESACYFAVAETLANAAAHASAHSVQVRMRHSGRGRAAGLLRIEVTDDGIGGADAANGTGLAGVERRLATFDGILAISSPAGGPTVIAMEVPCALSSPRTSSS
jgi:signal transduction histidine kinase